MVRQILLSNESKQLIKFVQMGLTNIEIGEELGYSPHTIKKKLRHLYKLFYASGRIDFVHKTIDYPI